MKRTAILSSVVLIGCAAVAQTKVPLPPLPAPQSVPKPAADTGEPYAPQSILPGGIVVPLFPPNSPYLKADKIHVPHAMLMAGVPNVELHLYGNGRHPGDPLPDGSRMSGGLTDRNNIPYGTWQFRFIDWARDLGFLQKPGIETKAAKDVASYVANPPRSYGEGRGGAGRGGQSPARGAPAAPGSAPAGDQHPGPGRGN
jgi:hypothetical protein